MNTASRPMNPSKTTMQTAKAGETKRHYQPESFRRKAPAQHRSTRHSSRPTSLLRTMSRFRIIAHGRSITAKAFSHSRHSLFSSPCSRNRDVSAQPNSALRGHGDSTQRSQNTWKYIACRKQRIMTTSRPPSQDELFLSKQSIAAPIPDRTTTPRSIESKTGDPALRQINQGPGPMLRAISQTCRRVKMPARQKTGNS